MLVLPGFRAFVGRTIWRQWHGAINRLVFKAAACSGQVHYCESSRGLYWVVYLAGALSCTMNADASVT